MTMIEEQFVDAGAMRTRVLRGGPDRAPIVFLHGGLPGVTPYCSGAHLWSPALAHAARERHVVALDLPGSGGTALSLDAYTIDGAGRVVLSVLAQLGLDACHIVGSDEGGLMALWLALEAPGAVRSVTVVTGPTPAPSGDGAPNLTFAYPPPPLWSRASQAWALDRISYSGHHVDDALLDRCVECAAGPAHQSEQAQAAEGSYRRTFARSVASAKARYYAASRGEGMPVPVQLVWTTDSPFTTLEHGMVIFRTIAQGQRQTAFHLMNRNGALPFREEPEEFCQIISAFHDTVETEAA
jgi:2-hydroxy-6-oxonona-2,4-dienedioate hydrolase